MGQATSIKRVAFSAATDLGAIEVGPLPYSPVASLLSVREREIAVLVAQGLSNKEIALQLGISPWTVSAHLRRVFAKLDIGRRIELCLLLLPTMAG